MGKTKIPRQLPAPARIGSALDQRESERAYMDVHGPHRLVEQLTERISPLEGDFHRAYWESQIDASPETEHRRSELELELRRVKGDTPSLRAVESALAEEVHEPLLLRQLEVLRLSLTANQMDETLRTELVELESAVESDFAAFRPNVDGRRINDNEIEEILKSSADVGLRERAWIASKEIGAVVASRVREMARLRNVSAVELGYPDYYAMSLDLQELSEEWLFDVLDEVERLTEGPYLEWKSALDSQLAVRFGTDALYPWHYADPFFQHLPPDGRVSLDEVLAGHSAPELAEKTFRLWGMDLSGVMEASDLYPREGKSQHAFCIDIDRSGTDVRILANVVPGERWVEVMLHESGHAAYDVGISGRLPYFLRRPTHTFVTEAIAILSGRLVRDPHWLVDVAGVSPTEVGELELDLRRSTGAQALQFVRWGLVVVHFERAMYRDPESDLDSLWWDLVERFQDLNRPPDRSAPDWAAKIHVAAAPVYYQNYLLGEMLASQLHRACRDEAGGLVGVEEAGRLLAERVFEAGGSKRWDAIIEGATGRALSAEDFAADTRL